MEILFAQAVDVTQNCVRRRFRSASCHACADVCPARAFSMTDGKISVDASLCIECGDCLFVCPTDAISGISPQKRYLHDDALVGPFSPIAPTVNELLLWHVQRGVRSISLDAERFTAWMVALAGLNLALREYGEPVWTFRPVQQKEISVTRRTLMHVPREEVNACAVLPGMRQLRQAFIHFSEYDPDIDPGKCVLCGACWRSCTEGALSFEEGRLAIEPGRCTGCGGCESVCHHQAVKLAPYKGEAQRRVMKAHASTCKECSRSFWTFSREEARCYLCKPHHHGMRR
ncbi:4Fe-4S dicluster domain-containing protein [Enterobacter sp. RIT418]|nr:ferredoxin [Enterobacter sp. RIT 418]